MSGLLAVGLTAVLLMCAAPGHRSVAASLPPEPAVTLLDLHPVDPATFQNNETIISAVPRIVRRGQAGAPDSSQVTVPVVVTPLVPGGADSGPSIGKSGTGFFIGEDGTLLTAAHVARGCTRMQVISQFVTRAWVSLVAADPISDIAILKVPNLRSPAVLHLAAAAPAKGKLLILGYPAGAGLTVPVETAAVMLNEKFPANVGSLANPRDLLWMSAPGVSHGYSGGPIFDPRTGAVVGIVKGEVDGGYLRLLRDMPTTGIAIGPGVGQIRALARREIPYASVSLASSPGAVGRETVRRATVHVLCWQ
jgi:S1-C subfamily serine protease